MAGRRANVQPKSRIDPSTILMEAGSARKPTIAPAAGNG
jgi:hypothetical protein